LGNYTLCLVALGWMFWTVGKVGVAVSHLPLMLGILFEGVARLLPRARKEKPRSPHWQAGLLVGPGAIGTTVKTFTSLSSQHPSARLKLRGVFQAKGRERSGR
jgi:hypothetical protein